MKGEGFSEKINSIPAPWDLYGDGYILLYWFKKKFIQNTFLPSFLTEKLIFGVGSVMIVNYTKSNAGAYNELLFIPGLFKFEGLNFS